MHARQQKDGDECADSRQKHVTLRVPAIALGAEKRLGSLG